jgi:ATP-dependent DNA ligase
MSVRLAPEYEGVETNMGIEVLFKSIAKATGVSRKLVKEEFLNQGDLGVVCEQIMLKKIRPKKSVLTFATVFQSFREISQTTGQDSVSKK